MHARLVSYLRDNRDQIIENWLSEAEIPAPAGSTGGESSSESGVVPYEFYTSAFNAVLEMIEKGIPEKTPPQPQAIHLNQFLGLTCECRDHCFGGRVCMELQDSGLDAFMSVFAEEWDTGHEFSALDRECSQDLIHHALSGFFGREVELCQHRDRRSDCPFTTKTTENESYR